MISIDHAMAMLSSILENFESKVNMPISAKVRFASHFNE